MKLYCLSGHPNRPCFVLKFKSTTILLDCGLDVSTLLHFCPLPLVPGSRLSRLTGWSASHLPMAPKLHEELKECAGRLFVDSEPEFALPELCLVDMSEIDVILLSNYHCMLALPYITEYTSFKGVVYATEPTLHMGRQYMEELVEYIQRVPKQSRASKWKQPNILSYLPVPLRDAVNPTAWRHCYNQHDIHTSLSKVTKVGFSEKLDIFGALTVTPVSSGFCLGSCNWIIQSDYEKISYVSGSSTLTTHPKPLEQTPLRYSDILIISGLTQTPIAHPDNMIGEFCVNTAMTLKNGGNVLVPCYPSGVTFDLFECLSTHLENSGLGGVPLYFISPVAKSSLAYSNIYAEWLSTGKQSKVYLPEHPFPHAELVKNNRLFHYSSIYDDFNTEMKTPCVVFTGHPSLRCGDVVHFLELWGGSSGNTVIFTEPDFPYLEALAPYQPMAMKVCYSPIDTSLSFAQANKLIKDLKPIHLVIPDQYTAPPLMWPHRTDLVVEYDPAPLTYKRGDIHTLPIRRLYEKVDLDPELAEELVPSEVKPGVAVAMVTGNLSVYDNKYTLQMAATKGRPTSSTTCGVLLQPVAGKKRTVDGAAVKPQPTYVWGVLDVHEFVNKLKQQGISDVKVEDCPGGLSIVHLPSEDTLIQIEEGSTHIICQGNEGLRVKLRDTLLKCLAKF